MEPLLSSIKTSSVNPFFISPFSFHTLLQKAFPVYAHDIIRRKQKGRPEGDLFERTGFSLSDAGGAPQDRFAETEQCFINYENIMLILFQKIANDHITPAAGGKRVSGPRQQIQRLVQGKLQSDGQGKGRIFFRMVSRIASDLGKQFSVQIGFFINFRIGKTFFLCQPKQHFRESVSQIADQIFQTAFLYC